MGMQGQCMGGAAGGAATLLTLFLVVLMTRKFYSYASPNLFISQLVQWEHHHLQTSPATTHSRRPAPAHARAESDAAPSQPRVALCLVGGARAFELTAESILHHLIEPDRSDWIPDVFLHAPLDADAHKFTLLGHNISARSRRRFATARIFHPEPLPESDFHDELLRSESSPNGIQGLLQYFNLVEGCLDMIVSHEDRHGFRYDWVARTRVDGFWAGPLPALHSLNASAYYVPIGSQFNGSNDRFGLGSRNVSVAALARVSLLPFLHERGCRKLNSELAFKAQLNELQIPCETIPVPFCVLSRRTYKWPLAGPRGVPVASIDTVGALNGVKCRPCTPVATGSDAEQAVSELLRSFGWPGDIRGLALCDASRDWDKNWQQLYAKVAGRRFDHHRERVLSRTREECEADVVRFGKQWEIWDAPPPEQICESRKPPR